MPDKADSNHDSLQEQLNQDHLMAMVDSMRINDEHSRRAPLCVGRCDIELGDVTKHNIMQLKRLNMAVFPVTYYSKYYHVVLSSGELTKLAYFNDIVVGAVCCRIDVDLDADGNPTGTKRLYIMTLGTLAPYRKYGVGTLLLNHVFSLCKKDPQIRGISLHVQVNNESAMNFYKSFDFEVVGTAEKYYKQIQPDDAFILEKRVNCESK